MTVPASRSMTNNEANERLIAGRERCGSCSHNADNATCTFPCSIGTAVPCGVYHFYPVNFYHAYRGFGRPADERPRWFETVADGPLCPAYVRRQP